MAVTGAPQFYMDDKWKLSKKEGSSRSVRGSSSTTTATSNSSSSSDSHFMRSRSCHGAADSSSSSSSSHFMRSRSCAGSDSHLLRNQSQRTSSSRSSFSRKCATLVKEQRAKFYIMRRCVTMLICWRDRSSGSK